MAVLDNVQAIVARSSAREFFAVLLFRICDPAAARSFLRQWSGSVPGGVTPETGGREALHFLFSWNGLAQLLAGNPQLDVERGRKEFDSFFVEPEQSPGSQAMADQLGFSGDSAPTGWWGGFKSGDIDIAVYGCFETDGQRTQALAALRASARTSGLAELPVTAFPQEALAGYRPPNGRLHFGYRDGISAPAVDWADEGAAGTVNPREFIVGYPNADYPTAPRRPGPWQDFAREGSYGCLTWLYQDVAVFNAFLRDNAERATPFAAGADPQEWLAAKMLGRWRNGTPLSLHPGDQPGAPVLSDDFGYADDPAGLKCPLTAHIRVVHPRDEPLKFANRVRFPGGPPRLIRRGFSYGPPLTSAADDRQDRGLVGFFFCARVNEQFYTILRWMQLTDFSDALKSVPDGFRRQDALLGNRAMAGANTAMHVPHGSGQPFTAQLANFIRYRGVAVLFAPSLAGLAMLSRVGADG